MRSALRHFIYKWWQSCSLPQAEPEGRRPVCDGEDGVSQSNTLPLLSHSTVLRRKFFGSMFKYQRQNQWCWGEFRGGREVNGLGWINNKLESLIKTWSDMPASFPSLLLSVPALNKARGSWGVNKSFLVSDFASLHNLHIWGYIVPVPKMMWHDKWRDKRYMNLMQETMCNFCLCGASCTADRLSNRGMLELRFVWVLFSSVLVEH